jgi:hypothetical protein
MNKLFFIGVFSLLFQFLGFAQDAKKNREKYINYISPRYNTLVETGNKLGGISLYSMGHRGSGHLDYVTRTNPFPEDEGLKCGQFREKFHPKTLEIGKRFGKLLDIVNSVTAKWTMENLNELKGLVSDINKHWIEFGTTLQKTFPPNSATAKERPIGMFFDDFKNWKVKSVADLDRE